MLRNLQPNTTQLRLVESCDTRWNSQHAALTRLIQLKDDVTTVLKKLSETAAKQKPTSDETSASTPKRKTKHNPSFLVEQLTPEWWTRAAELKQLLIPFQVAINHLQKNGASLQTVNVMYNYIHECLEAMTTKAVHMKESAATALAKFNTSWAPLNSERQARDFVRLFMMRLSGPTEAITWDSSNSSEANEKIIMQTVKWYCHWGAKYLINNGVCDSQNESTNLKTLSNQLNLQWDYFNARKSPEMRGFYPCFKRHLRMLDDSDVAEVNDALTSDGIIHKIKYTTHAEEAALIALASLIVNKELGITITALLQTVPSEAAVERTFSAQGLIQSDLRNRLGDETVMDELTIKFNRRALMQDIERCTISHVRELEEDVEYPDDDDVDYTYCDNVEVNAHAESTSTDV